MKTSEKRRTLGCGCIRSWTPSARGNCLADNVFVDDVHGRVRETERIMRARQDEVEWCRGMRVRAPVLRKDVGAEGAKAVSLRWIDTDKGDARRPNYRCPLVVREINQESHEEI